MREYETFWFKSFPTPLREIIQTYLLGPIDFLDYMFDVFAEISKGCVESFQLELSQKETKLNQQYEYYLFGQAFE
jgi:hypothetical protein